MRHLFESLDTDHSGTISYAKLHKGLDEKCHVRLVPASERVGCNFGNVVIKAYIWPWMCHLIPAYPT